MERIEVEFFDCGAVELARKLVGRVLCVSVEGKCVRAVITETEAYCENDTACHANKGRTKRNDPMFYVGGTIYVYLCYGIHEMLNISAGAAGSGQAVLIRGVEILGGRRLDGPGKVTKALGITQALNYEDVSVSDKIWLEVCGAEIEQGESDICGVQFEIEELTRVGIGYASKQDQERLWRFRAKG